MTKRRSCDAAAAEAGWRRRRREQGAPMGAAQVTRRYTVELRHQPQMRGEAERSEAFFSKDLQILKRLLIISSKISTSGGGAFTAPAAIIKTTTRLSFVRRKEG